jgi:hypothetical protein
MSHDAQIQNYISQNQWSKLETFLQLEKGFIDPRLGGRYFGGNHIEIDGCSDLDRTCWKVFEASFNGTMRSAPANELSAIKNVIGELKRLYTETETRLSQSSQTAWAMTRFYDKLQECLDDGYSPIERLEKKLIPYLDSVLKV